MQTDFDNDLLSYFTDVERLQNVFKEYLASPSFPKRLLVIHGVGGVGKSSLLRMFRLHAKNARVPIALTSAEESKSSVDVLSNWSSDLKSDGVTLNNFQKTLVHYKAIQAKLEDEAKKAQEARKKAAEKIGKAVVKAVVGTAINLIPGMPIVTALGGVGADALMDWLSGFLSKPDIELLFDPAKTLSKDFLEDTAKAARKHRLVLMLDTFEQMAALNDWVCSIAKQLDENILLVVAGREMVNWDKQWESWLAYAQIEELEPMTEEHMRELARRYFATMVGGEPDPKQIEAIIVFARGLPMVVATAVRLWVKYRQEFNIEDHKTEVYGDVVKRLREGVPPELLPILEAAAIVRWFDRPILRAITKMKDVNTAYEELRRFPFIKSRREGLSLHDSVRAIIEETIKTDDPDSHKIFHENAAKYFEKRLKKATTDEAERLELEILYHRVRENEEKGIRLYSGIANEYLSYRLINRFRSLVNDSNNYPLNSENSRLWRGYYNALLDEINKNYDEAALNYERISTNIQAESRLRAYALGELGLYYARVEYLHKHGAEKAIKTLKNSLALWNKADLNTVRYSWELLAINKRLSQWEEVEKQFKDFTKLVDQLDLNWSLQFKGTMKDVPGTIGDWRRFLDFYMVLSSETEHLPRLTKTRSLLHWIFALVWMGRYAEVEAVCDIALEVYKDIGDDPHLVYRNLGLALGFQRRFSVANEYFNRSLGTQKDFSKPSEKRRISVLCSFWGAVNILEGNLLEARKKLVWCLRMKREFKDNLGIPELMVGLGNIYEMEGKLKKAINYYKHGIELKWTGRKYFYCGALTGLIRVKYLQREYDAIPPLLAEAEKLARQYEYNDRLASLRLTQGHIAWEQRPIKVLKYYQHSLIYALRYNRFLLDEILGEQLQNAPLQPIIPFCLERGEDGRKMLGALRKWWKTGKNNVGISRPDTISPIPEGIPLLEAEKIAREREPGDGSAQKSVLEQIEAAIGE